MGQTGKPKCAVTQGTQKGRFWVRQVSLTVTSTTGQHGHGTARSHLHTQRTHDGPSVSYCSTVATHHRFELKYVAFKGAEAMRESSSNAAMSKAAMVDIATRVTTLGESEHATFDLDDLPSVPVALQELIDTQVELREVLSKYDACLKAAGKEDDDTGKSIHAFSLPLLPPPRVVESPRGGGGPATDTRRQIRFRRL